MKIKIGVVGEGAWGSAIATLLAHNGHEVILWCHDEKTAQEISQSRTNTRYLPGITFSHSIKPVTDFSAISECDWIAEAIPTQHLRSVLMRMRPHLTRAHRWILLSKGLEKETFLFPSQILQDVFGSSAAYAVISGPTYAHELARQQVSAATVAAGSDDLMAHVCQLFQSDYFKLYSAHDVMGVEVGGACKNVIALALGMLEGAGYGQNTRAFFLTRGFQEIAKIAHLFGAQKSTLYGLSGIGDLILTSYGGLSKNSFVGKKIAEGFSLDQIISEHAMIPEGVNTVDALVSYVSNQTTDFPIITAIWRVIYQKMTVKEMVSLLMNMSVQSKDEA